MPDTILLMGGIVCLFAFFNVVYWYVWRDAREFAGIADITIKLVLPGLLCAALISSLRSSPESKANLAIFFVSSLFSIYIAELVLRASQKLGTFDTRTRLEVVTDLRNRGIDAVPVVFPAVLWERQQDGSMKSAIRINGSEVLPLGGIAKKLTVMCNETGEWVTYRSDEHGFNNPEGTWRLRNLSIAAVGDSFAFGACVAADKNFVAEIRRTYPATLNLGINGAGPLVEFAAVKEFLALFRPKVTLWFYLELNDHSELSREKRSGLLMQYLNDNFKQGLVGRQSEIDRALKEFVDRKLSETKEGGGAYFKYALNVIKLSTLRTKLGLVQGTPEAEFNELPITLFRDILKSTQAFVKTWAGSLYFVYLPAWQRYVNPGSAPDDRDAMLKLIRGLDIPVIDVHQAFAAHGDPLRLFPFRKQGHYNDEGHRQVAQTVVRSLTSRP